MTKRFFLSLLIGTFLFANAADAFRPSSRWILDQVAVKRLKLKVRTLKAELEETIYDRKDAPRGLRVESQIWILAPYQVRTQREFPAGKSIFVYTKKKSYEEEPGKLGKSKKTKSDFAMDLFSAGSPLERRELGIRLEKDLDALKVDSDIVSYARLNGRVAFVIGAKPWEKDKPQVWIDKDTKQLLRIIERKGRHTFDTRYENWGSAQGGDWLPQSIKEYKNGKLIRRVMTRSVKKNKTVEKALFDTKS